VKIDNHRQSQATTPAVWGREWDERAGEGFVSSRPGWDVSPAWGWTLMDSW